MRIIEHNLDSLRRLVRELQQENEALKTLLAEHSIPFESRNLLDETSVPDEYDEDQRTEKETLTELIKLRNEMRKEELMEAVIKSDRSYAEIMAFIKGEAEAE